MKETPKGQWIDTWHSELQAAELKPVDVTTGLADLLACKDEKEVVSGIVVFV
jgi:hypothetical protein